MEQSQNPRTVRARRVQFVDSAPQAHSSRLQSDLDYAHQLNERLQRKVNRLEVEKANLRCNKRKLSYLLEHLESEIRRLEELLKLRETEFEDVYKESYDTIVSLETQISSLEEQLDRTQHLSKQEKDEMAARLESEKEKLQESAFLLQNDLQQKLDQMEQQLHQRDNEVLVLQKDNDDLSHRLTEATADAQKLIETTNELRSCRIELIQCHKCWREDRKALEEKFRGELIQKQQECEKTLQLLEEEKKNLVQKEQDWEKRLKLLEDEKDSRNCS